MWICLKYEKRQNVFDKRYNWNIIEIRIYEKKHNGLWAISMKTEQNKQLDNSYQCDNLNNLDLKKKMKLKKNLSIKINWYI